MNEEQKRLLAEVKKRIDANFAFKSFGSGLSVAGQYMKGWFDCIDSDACDYLKNLNLQEAIKRADNTLTWCDSKATPSDATSIKGEDFDASLKRFKLPDGIEVPKNSLMVFRNVITTNDEDRDGDVLQTRGAKIDTPMPLLWQHNSALPIGKMLGVDKHTDKLLRVFSVLLDMNDLTEDTAKLIEAGAMRISHGFIPLKFKEREEDSKRVPWRGFEINEFEIMEESVVSVPSNRAAVIDMSSRDAFKSPEMKTIGRLLEKEETGKIWPGFDLIEKKRREFDLVKGDGEDDGEDDESKCENCDDPKCEGCEGKSAKDGGCRCGGTCKKCKADPVQITLSIDKEQGDRKETITIKGTDDITAKLIEAGIIKGGRELSKANVKKLEDVVEDLKEIKQDAELSRAHMGLINKNIGALKEMIEKSQPEDPIEGEDGLLPDGEQAPKSFVKGKYQRRGQKGVYIEIEGSAESKRKKVDDAVADALKSAGLMTKDDWSHVVASFPDKGIVYASLWKRSENTERFFELEYKFSDDGEVTVEGTPKEIDIDGIVKPKQADDGKSPLKTAVQFITFDADSDQLKRIEEVLAARKEVEESYQVGEEYRQLIGKS